MLMCRRTVKKTEELQQWQNENNHATKLKKTKGKRCNQNQRKLGLLGLQKPIHKCAALDDKSRGMHGMAAIRRHIQTGVEGWSENENAGHDVAIVELGPEAETDG